MYFSYLLLFYSLKKIYGFSEIPVFSSKLEITMINEEVEIFLKDRHNIAVEIHPSPTIPSSINDSSIKLDAVNATPEVVAELSEEQIIPSVAALYHYDKAVVKLFRTYLEEQKGRNLSSAHRNLISRYIDEWDELILDSSTEKEGQAIVESLGVPSISLPMEIGSMYKLVRMNHRVRVELPIILNFSAHDSWNDFRIKVHLENFKTGEYFSPFETNLHPAGMLRLSEIYFSNPAEFYPDDVLSKIPLKDLLSAAISEYNEASLPNSLEWLSFAKGILKDRHVALNRSETQTPANIEHKHRVSEEDDQTTRLENLQAHLNYVNYYMDIIENIYSLKSDQIRKFSEIPSEPKDESDENVYYYTYGDLCNGKNFRTPKQMASLKCRYDHRNVPWLFLMPARVEELYHDPEILFFHHVLTEEKIKSIQQLALPFQTQAGFLYNGGHHSDHNIRSSYVNFVKEKLTEDVKDVNRITACLTGLQVSKENASESLQVNVYTPGGHYLPHMDSFEISDNATETHESGESSEDRHFAYPDNRLATLMFYLNDVDEGGRTIFTRLGFSVEPEGGGAVLWYSLDNSGQKDERLMHAGCPVASGLKWVANKWIRYNAQLFNRPCLPR